MQEYLKLNKKLLNAIVLIGANAAGLSDLAMAWLDAEGQLYDWEASDFLFEGPLADANFMSVKALFAKRKNDALRPQHFLALLTDPRHRARKSTSIGSLAAATRKTLATHRRLRRL
jgi:hypothetical protein